jgi:hypothetical protein
MYLAHFSAAKRYSRRRRAKRHCSASLKCRTDHAAFTFQMATWCCLKELFGGLGETGVD